MRLNKNGRSFLLIFLCFFFSSGMYLSWVYRMAEMVPAAAVDSLSMVAGYLCQAAGLLLFSLAEQRRPALIGLPSYVGCLVLLMLCGVPSARSGYLAGVLIFGFLMNLLIGLIAGFYLRGLFSAAGEERCGLVFGGGYGAATIAVWLISRLGGQNLLKTGYAFLFYIFAAVCSVFFLRGDFPTAERAPSGGGHALPENSRKGILLSAVTVLLLSLVKNIGFSFPTADLVQGIDLELSRVLYAAGLLAAGCISDRSRKYGAVCTLAALVIPFIMIALRGEPISATVFWALDYLFYGFFSVFRVLLFSDLARKLSAPHLAGCGLLFGRVGDALGTGAHIVLSGRVTILILFAAVLFVLTVLLFFRLYENTYLSDPVKEKNDREVFEHFSARYALSPKERAVMRLVIAERSNAEIAQALYVSESTVKFHVHNILKKTGCKNRSTLLTGYHELAGKEER